MDFIARKKVSLKMSYTLMDSLPFPRLSIDDPRVTALAPRVLQLTCTGPEMIPFWNAMAAHGWVETVSDSAPPPGIADPEHRLQLIAEIEAIVARDIFSLTADEIDYVLETFPIVKRRDVRKYGDYRTKLLILDAYSQLDASSVSGMSSRSQSESMSASGYELADLVDRDLSGATVPVRVTNAAGESEELPFRFLSPRGPAAGQERGVIVRHPDPLARRRHPADRRR